MRTFYSLFHKTLCRALNAAVVRSKCSGVNKAAVSFIAKKKPENKSELSTLFVAGHRGHNVYQIVKPFIDVNHLFNNAGDIFESCRLRGIDIDFPAFLDLTAKWKSLRQSFTVLEDKNDYYNEERRNLEASSGTQEELDQLNAEHEDFLKGYRIVKNELYDLEGLVMPMFKIMPNCLHSKTPRHTDTNHNVLEARNFDFQPLSHVKLGEMSKCLEFNSVSPTSYYLKEKLALMEIAIQDFFTHELTLNEFTNMICTDYCKSFIIEACGKNPHSYDCCIPIKTKGRSGGQYLNLIGTASLESLCAYLVNMNINRDCLPLKYFCCGRYYDASQRNSSEASLFNVVQSINVQCLMLSEQDRTEVNFEELKRVIHSFYFQLGLPFRMTDVSVEHLNITESRRVQFEIWSPHVQKYIPCGHVAVINDFISKRLRATYGVDLKVAGYLHIVEGVAAKVPTLIACIMENFQNSDGCFALPEVLKKYMLM